MITTFEQARERFLELSSFKIDKLVDILKEKYKLSWNTLYQNINLQNISIDEDNDWVYINSKKYSHEDLCEWILNIEGWGE